MVQPGLVGSEGTCPQLGPFQETQTTADGPGIPRLPSSLLSTPYNVLEESEMTARGRPREGVPVDLHERPRNHRSLSCKGSHDKPLPLLLPARDRGDSGDRPLRSTPQPLNSPPRSAGLALTLATPPNPGSGAPNSSSRFHRGLGAAPGLCPGPARRGCPGPGWNAHPECSAAARDPPPPRGLHGVSWSSRGPGWIGRPLAAGRAGC